MYTRYTDITTSMIFYAFYQFPTVKPDSILTAAGERHRLVRGGIETYGCRSPPQAPKRLGRGALLQ